jgi:hypothetical protein
LSPFLFFFLFKYTRGLYIPHSLILKPALFFLDFPTTFYREDSFPSSLFLLRKELFMQNIQQQIINHINTSRFLIYILILTQFLTLSWIAIDIKKEHDEKLNKLICVQEMIPLEPIPMEELE